MAYLTQDHALRSLVGLFSALAIITRAHAPQVRFGSSIKSGAGARYAEVANGIGMLMRLWRKAGPLFQSFVFSIACRPLRGGIAASIVDYFRF